MIFGGFRTLKRLVSELPQQLRLSYCLVRDPRVPLYTKAAFVVGLGVLVSPVVEIPDEIPLLGQIDEIALTLLASRLFIAACPDDVVIDIEQLIIEQRSAFDEDVRRGEKVALAIWRRFRPEENELSGAAEPAGQREPSPAPAGPA